MNETKTPIYSKTASIKYQRTKERVNLLLDTGTKDRIKQKYGNISINKYIKDLVNKDLQDINIKPVNSETENENPFTDLIK